MHPSTTFVNYALKGHSASLGHVRVPDAVIGGLRHAWTEDNRWEWTTEIVGKESENVLWVTVRVFCDVVQVGGRHPAAVKKPHIIKLIVLA